jgi:hypothetical protein
MIYDLRGLRCSYSPQIIHRQHTGREFCDMLVDQFEEMLEQSARHAPDAIVVVNLLFSAVVSLCRFKMNDAALAATDAWLRFGRKGQWRAVSSD